MVSWSSRKQPTIADSSCYAEYIALHDAAHKVVFMRQLLEGLHVLLSGPTQLFCDNDAATRLSEDHVWHSHTKHIRCNALLSIHPTWTCEVWMQPWVT
jgi:hypothetical protein